MSAADVEAYVTARTCCPEASESVTAGSASKVDPSDALVGALRSSMASATSNLGTLPKLVKRLLTEERWRSRRLQTGQVVEFGSFAEFVTAPPLAGLGTTLDTLRALLAPDAEACAALDREAGPALSSLVCLADVEPEDVEFLHVGPLGDGWFPRGKHVEVAGPPDSGKTTLMLEVAARLSNAGLSTLFLTAEDGIGDTIRPRAGAAGADLTRVHVLDLALSLPTDADMGILEAALVKTGAAMLVIDPLVAFLEVRDGHSNAIVRRALAPLVALCRRLGVCLVAIAHLRKSLTGDSKSASNGSGAFVANARSQIVVAPDPDDPDLRIVSSGKMNLTAKPPSQSFRLESAGKVARIRWQGESARTADELCAPREGQEDREGRTEAEEWLGRMLAEGTCAARDLQREARAAGLGWRSVERAKASLGVVARRSGFGPGGAWVWVRMGSMADNGGVSDSHSPPKAVNTAIRTEREPGDEGDDSLEALWEANGVN